MIKNRVDMADSKMYKKVHKRNNPHSDVHVSTSTTVCSSTYLCSWRYELLWAQRLYVRYVHVHAHTFTQRKSKFSKYTRVFVWNELNNNNNNNMYYASFPIDHTRYTRI